MVRVVVLARELEVDDDIVRPQNTFQNIEFFSDDLSTLPSLLRCCVCQDYALLLHNGSEDFGIMLQCEKELYTAVQSGIRELGAFEVVANQEYTACL